MFLKLFPVFLILFLLQNSMVRANRPVDYFQQRADHTIHARLDDQKHMLYAHITTQYHNNSPDTLHKLLVHLWPNAYSGRHTAFAQQRLLHGRTDFHFARNHELGFIDSLNFKVNNLPVNWRLDPENPDIGIIELSTPLLPGQMLELSTPFRLKFPSARFSRLGHDGQAYYATQWYPKPAVYDKNGWNAMPYLDLGEFYADFGQVDVFLTLPKNYVVASSGIIMTEAENSWLDERSKATIDQAEKNNLPDRIEFPPSETELKTIHLHQKNVHDFAWFADKRYYVIKVQMTLNESGRKIAVKTFFNARADHWLKTILYAGGAIEYMSDKVFEYPWDVMSMVQGLNIGVAGMEYPAVTIIGSTSSPHELERIVAHEIIHNWFYGILATNERRHPWLDEGLTTFYETRYFEDIYPGRKYLETFAETRLARFFDVSRIDYIDYINLWYLFNARRNLDQPVNLTSEAFTESNYFAMPYFKAALAFLHLEAYLGRDVFHEAIRQFTHEWAFAHPDPAGFRKSMEESTGKDLSWFFDEVVATNKKIDYSILDLKPYDRKNFAVNISNKGQISTPFSLSGIKNGEVVETIWYEGFEGSQSVFFPRGNYQLIQIDHGRVIPTINRRNDNFWPGKLFPKLEPLRLQYLGSVENAEKTQVFFAPVIGWNQSNGFMGGLALFNAVFPARSTELFVMPMYGPFSNRLAGSAWLYTNLFPERGLFHNVRAGLNLKRYGHTRGIDGWDYNRLGISLTGVLRKANATSTIDRHFFINSIFINRNVPEVVSGEVQARNINYLVNEAGFEYRQNRVLNPWETVIKLETGNEFLKISGSAQWFLHYNKMPKGVSVRVFAGSFLLKPASNSLIDYRMRLGAQRGMHDYSFSNTFLGRSALTGTFWGNQVFETEGGFKFPTPVGQTWDWLAAINIKADFPVLPIRAYFDAGTYAGAANAFEGSTSLSWVLGLQLVPIKGLVEINFPLAVSKDIEQVANFAFENYWQKITFSIYLDRMNPFRYLRELGLRTSSLF